MPSKKKKEEEVEDRKLTVSNKFFTLNQLITIKGNDIRTIDTQTLVACPATSRKNAPRFKAKPQTATSILLASDKQGLLTRWSSCVPNMLNEVAEQWTG